MDSSDDYAAFLKSAMPALLRYGTALTGNPHDGADLVQICCEKIALRWDSVRTADRPLLYIKAAMANARISSWRKTNRESLLAEMPEVGACDSYPADSAHVWSAVAGLPRRQRAVIVLRYVEGHSEAEIASMLGIASGTVKSQAAKAIRSLRESVPTLIEKEV